MIPDPVVEEVRSRADIVEIIGEHVSLKKAGKEYKARCPFHEERTPSFYVVPGKGFYKCFGCGESGDVFSFLMKRQGLGFLDAVRAVAKRVGVEIPDAEPQRRSDEAHRPLYEAIAFAAEFYQRQLWEEPAGERARAYLERRGIDRASAERFQLGAAPDAWRALREAAAHHGIDDAVLLEAGLIKESERSEEPYDRLRDRLVFPIAETSGRIVAFGGRVLGPAGEAQPKYLNSPETPIYHKGELLYGLAWSKNAIRREEAALVVEGYMDYVSLAARGIENVVAPLGTAMTAEQAALLGRYTKTALLLYDSDAAGLRATFKSADALLAAGLHALVVTLPRGEDPDSVAREGGAAALRPYLDAAVDVIDRKLQILDERGYFEDIEHVRKALDGLLPTLRAAQDAALRDIYIARIAERTGVRRETLEREVAEAGRRGDAGAGRRGDSAPVRVEAGPGAPAAAETRPDRKRAAEPRRAGERKLLLLLLRDRERIPAAAEAIEPEELDDPVNRALFQALVRAGGLPPDGPAALGLEGPAATRLEELLADPEELSDADRIFRDSVQDIKVEPLYRRLDELRALLPVAQGRGEEQQVGALLAEMKELAQRLQSMAHKGERLMRKSARSGARRPSTPKE